jgi:hypothetical protein
MPQPREPLGKLPRCDPPGGELPEQVAYRDHVQTVRRQPKNRHADFLEPLDFNVDQLTPVRQRLQPIYGQEVLTLDGRDVHAIGVLVTDIAAGVAVQSLNPGLGAAARQGERQSAEGEQLKFELRAGARDLGDRGQGKFDVGAQTHTPHPHKLRRRRSVVNVQQWPGDERRRGPAPDR